jgi:hypothetical protein
VEHLVRLLHWALAWSIADYSLWGSAIGFVILAGLHRRHLKR